MALNDVVQSHLEVLMRELLGSEEVHLDDDGDIGVSRATGSWWARVRTSTRGPHIEVFSVVVTGVDSGLALLEALNAMNVRLSHCRVFHTGRDVVVAGELLGEPCTLEDLACLSAEVAQVADEQGHLLSEAFGLEHGPDADEGDR